MDMSLQSASYESLENAFQKHAMDSLHRYVGLPGCDNLVNSECGKNWQQVMSGVY